MGRKEKIDNIDLPERSKASMDMMKSLAEARHHAERLRYWISSMPYTPKWESMAESEMKEALEDLKAVERLLIDRLALYSAKPKGD